jgi:hypothetical protein
MKTRALFLLPIFIGVGVYVWYVHFHYRFETIDENKVYKSAAIPPDELAYYLQKHHIKTVIDLRDGGSYSELNPVNQSEIDAEAAAIAKIGGVEHINIPSPQVPTRETLTRFLTVMNDKNAYPVLIHCYHGTGRAQMYSALYRIEYLKMSSEEARLKTRLVTQMAGYKSSFSPSKEKGIFLAKYTSSIFGEVSTLATLPPSSFELTMK